MIDRTALASVLFAILVVVGMAVPAMALSSSTGESSAGDLTGTSTAGAGRVAQTTLTDQVAQTPATNQTTQNATTNRMAQNNSKVNATVGPQLSTVIDVSSDEVQTDFENAAFEFSIESASDEDRAEVIAERAEDLRDRAESIREDYEAATEAYEESEITKSAYARRLAVLNARATNLHNSYEQLRKRTEAVPASELRDAGVTESALNRSIENLSSVTGTGARALFKQFTGESEGEIELETAGGLSIEVESEDGERSREFERPRDDNSALTVSRATALETARGALSATDGNWVLTDSETAEDDGAYEYTFALRDAANLTGEAEVSVDGSSGDIFALEESIEPRDDDESEDADEAETPEEAEEIEAPEETETPEGDSADDSDRELTMTITEGTPAPNERITVQVLADGDPAENVTLLMNDRAVGTTDTDGRIAVTLPSTDDVELTAQTDDASDELEFEFDDATTDDNGDEDERETASPSESDSEA